MPEVTQSEEGQKQKLRIVLAAANKVYNLDSRSMPVSKRVGMILIFFVCVFVCLQVLGLPRWSAQKWSVESVHSKNIVSILHLLVALARQFRAPVRLPENIAVSVIIVQVSCIRM